MFARAVDLLGPLQLPMALRAAPQLPPMAAAIAASPAALRGSGFGDDGCVEGVGFGCGLGTGDDGCVFGEGVGSGLGEGGCGGGSGGGSGFDVVSASLA